MTSVVRFGWYFFGIFLFSASHSVAGKDPMQTRTIEFPRESIGKISFGSWPTPEIPWPSFDGGRPASGRIDIPSDKLVSLVVKKDIRALKTVPGDVIHDVVLAYECGDSELDAIEHFSHLRSLVIMDNNKFTGHGLRALRNMRELEVLNLMGCPITDVGVGMISQLPKLNVLVFKESKLTDRGMKALTGLYSLSMLSLNQLGSADLVGFNRIPVTDQGVESLSGLGGLESLYLDATSVTDRSLAQLAPLRGLKTLSLVATQITDEGIRDSVERFPKLETLKLDLTAITDESVHYITDFKNLKVLMIYGTSMTDHGKSVLRRLRPKLAISDDYHDRFDYFIKTKTRVIED